MQKFEKDGVIQFTATVVFASGHKA